MSFQKLNYAKKFPKYNVLQLCGFHLVLQCPASSSLISAIAPFCVHFPWGITKGMLKIQVEGFDSNISRTFDLSGTLYTKSLAFYSCLW